MKAKVKNPNNLYYYCKLQGFLEKDEEFYLINQWQKYQDQKAIEKIVSSYLRMIISIAKKHLNYGLPLEDLINEGVVGIIHALTKFDLSRNYRLSTYASWWIKASVQDYILKNWSIVRNGSSAAQKSLFFNLNKLKKQINDPFAEYLGEKELNIISSMLNAKKYDIQNMESKLASGDQFLNQTVYQDNNKIELISLLKDNSPNQDQVLEKNLDGDLRKKWIQKSLKMLKERERIILSARKLEEKARTLEELGNMLKISKERVRQIEKTALIKLKKILLKISNQPKNFFIQ